MSGGNEQDIARTLVKLLQENEHVQAAVVDLVCSCPNIVREY